MSRVGKKPIVIPEKVKVTLKGSHVEVQGPLGALSVDVHPRISVTMKDNIVTLQRSSDEELDRSLHGMERSRIYNMIKGVSEGFTRELSLVGVGYRAQAAGQKLVLQLGFSHPIEFDIPKNIQVKVDKQTAITLTGPDKEELGYIAAQMHALRPPEPYKGKGIRYKEEHVVRKAGKLAVAGGKKA